MSNRRAGAARKSATEQQHVVWPGVRRNLSRSATRALDVLDYMALLGRPMRAVEVAGGLDLTSSTADQLLKTMADSGYLIFDPRLKLYQPSPRLCRMASWVNAAFFGEGALDDVMRELAETTGQLVMLSARAGLFVQILEIAYPSDWPQPISSGTKLPLLSSTIGKALLLAEPDAELVDLAADCALSSDALDALRDDIRLARKDGYAFGRFTMTSPIATIALRLPSRGVSAPLVFSLSGPERHMLTHRVELARALGGAIERLMTNCSGFP